ncbi:Y-family DNA polymerase [Rubrivirga sp.]|uniref:Y-family DNA polymerase n=1 Tax=Rubrivirga sp. TaxID=1885344 RepID=UPI003C70884C
MSRHPNESTSRSGAPSSSASRTGERPRRLFALVDCSAFYCSCERVFDPSLEGVPVAVLSNNDGCVIARSQEVKDLGVPMGAPFFKVKDELATAGVRVFSSNYTLYGDMSRRVMATLETVTPDLEVYSVDEAFLSVPMPDGTPDEVCAEMERRAREIRAKVLRWTGIPVRVSWAETKTLAKAASEWAKARLKAGGEPCVCLWGHPDRDAWLESMAVGDVWGVGRRWSKRLEAMGAATAADLARLPSALVRQRFNVVLARTAMELGGVACLALEDAPVRKTLVKSRSFGEPVTDLSPLSQAVATHAARAAEKLRREGLVAGHIEALITTKHYGAGPHRSAARGEMLAEASSDSTALVAAARRCLGRCHLEVDVRGRPYRYRKAGVTLSEIRPAGTEQRSLFGGPSLRAIEDVQTTADRVRRAALMEALDAANRKFGKRAVVVSSQGRPSTLRRTRDTSGAPAWEMRRERMSPRYTTRWDELAVVTLGERSTLAPSPTPVVRDH